MRLLNQMLNLSRIFDRFSRKFDRVVIWNCGIKLIQTSYLKAAVTSRIKLGKCELTIELGNDNSVQCY